ncbi:MAG: chemotaxis protein CheD [Proteobacteria bacterium]|nr:chemotaxis protein CheD [Pseudomonadota bacterium]
MGQINVGIGELAVSVNPEEKIKTFGLGSCVAMIVLDPKIRAVGLIHIALPDSSINPDKANKQPGYFADTGIPYLMREMAKLGCHPKGKGFSIKLIGGAQVMDPNQRFNIGKRNVLTIKKILWSYQLAVVAEETGGNTSRTVDVEVKTGRVTISQGS